MAQGGYSITVSAIDHVTGVLDKINAKIEAGQKRIAKQQQAFVQTLSRGLKPIRDIGSSFKNLGTQIARFSKLTGMTKAFQTFGKVAQGAGHAAAWGFSKIKSPLQSVAKAGYGVVTSFGKIFAGLGAITGAGSIAGMYRLLTVWGRLGTRVLNASAYLGVSAQRIQTLGRVGELAGAAPGAMESTLQNVGDKAQDAAAGRADPATYRLFQLAGIRYRKPGTDYEGEDPEKVLAQEMDFIHNMGGSAATKRRVAGQFGITDPALIRAAIENGSKLLKEQGDEMVQYGVLNEKGIHDADEMRQAQTRLGWAFEGVGLKLSSVLGPSVTRIIDDFANWIAHSDGVQKAITYVGTKAKELADYLEKVDWAKFWTSVDERWKKFLSNFSGDFDQDFFSGMQKVFDKVADMLLTSLSTAVKNALYGTPDAFGHRDNFIHHATGLGESGDQKGTVATYPGSGTQGSGDDRNSRDNNPGNLKFAGQAGATPDGAFARFPNMETGVAAALHQYLLYQDRGQKSISDMILTATPRSDNPNVDSYIAAVAKEMGVDKGAAIDLRNPDVARAYISAISKQEGGRADPTSIRRGVELLLNGTTSTDGATANVDQSKALENAIPHRGNDPYQVQSFLKENGVDLDASQSAWCAAFVNAALHSVGIKGTGSNVATSFENWGEHQDISKIAKGDVLVQARGNVAGAVGGHVGMATGLTRMKDGKLQVQMISGNYGGRVNYSWEDAGSVEDRRLPGNAAPASQASAVPSIPTTTRPIDLSNVAPGQTGTSSGGTAGSFVDGKIRIDLNHINPPPGTTVKSSTYGAYLGPVNYSTSLPLARGF